MSRFVDVFVVLVHAQCPITTDALRLLLLSCLTAAVKHFQIAPLKYTLLKQHLLSSKDNLLLCFGVRLKDTEVSAL